MGRTELLNVCFYLLTKKLFVSAKCLVCVFANCQSNRQRQGNEVNRSLLPNGNNYHKKKICFPICKWHGRDVCYAQYKSTRDLQQWFQNFIKYDMIYIHRFNRTNHTKQNRGSTVFSWVILFTQFLVLKFVLMKEREHRENV